MLEAFGVDPTKGLSDAQVSIAWGWFANFPFFYFTVHDLILHELGLFSNFVFAFLDA